MEKILKLSYAGFQIFGMLVSLYNKFYSYNSTMCTNSLKKYVQMIEYNDYENFSFIRILSDGVNKPHEEFLEVIDIAIQDLITSIKLGEL